LYSTLGSLLEEPWEGSGGMTEQSDDTDGFAVLIVDDDPTLRDLFADLLREHGWRVRTASDGAKAVCAVRQSRPDLVLMDYEMPVLDGLGAARQIRSLPGPPVPMIMISSRQDTATREAALAAGIGRYLVKPVSLALLLAIVREHATAARRRPQDT